MKELIDYLSSEGGIGNKPLLEKDIILHRLLCELLGNGYFCNNFAFKGGTCLIKCYYGYYRFSEDLDFSWINQRVFDGMSQGKIRRFLSGEIDKFALILQQIAERTAMSFKPDKSNKQYIELGGSNKFVTYKLWYISSVLNDKRFIKIQINFFELFKYAFVSREAKTIVPFARKKDIEFLFPEYASFLFTTPLIKCYSIKEILLEKIRAILTRRGIKARDFIDAFLIVKNEKIELKDFMKDISEKIQFMLRYDKYLQNLKDFRVEEFVLGEEEKLLIEPLGKGFKEFLPVFSEYLNQLFDKVSS